MEDDIAVRRRFQHRAVFVGNDVESSRVGAAYPYGISEVIVRAGPKSISGGGQFHRSGGAVEDLHEVLRQPETGRGEGGTGEHVTYPGGGTKDGAEGVHAQPAGGQHVEVDEVGEVDVLDDVRVIHHYVGVRHPERLYLEAEPVEDRVHRTGRHGGVSAEGQRDAPVVLAGEVKARRRVLGQQAGT